MKFSRLGRALPLWLVLCALVTTPNGAEAASFSQQPRTFDVEGRLVNGTAGAGPPSDLELKVIAFAENEIKGTWDAAVDADGRYRAAGVPWMEDVTYVLGADY